MPADSIVDGVRAIREAVAREHGDDIEAIVEALLRQEANNRTPVVSVFAKAPVRRGRGTESGIASGDGGTAVGGTWTRGRGPHHRMATGGS
jgi:hypothetical protein